MLRQTVGCEAAGGEVVETGGYDCARAPGLPCAGLVDEEHRPGSACVAQCGAQDPAVG